MGKDAIPIQTLCHCQALRQATRRITQLYDHALAPAGLRVTQFAILVRLAESGPISIRVLAERMVMDRATLGHNLRPLEARGLVGLAVGEDRRRRLVTLTDAGRALMPEARRLWRQAQITFEQSFGTEDAVALRGTLERLAAIEYGT